MGASTSACLPGVVRRKLINVTSGSVGGALAVSCGCLIAPPGRVILASLTLPRGPHCPARGRGGKVFPRRWASLHRFPLGDYEAPGRLRWQAHSTARVPRGAYPSAAAQAVFVRLVPLVTVRVALMDAENRVPESSFLPRPGWPRASS